MNLAQTLQPDRDCQQLYLLQTENGRIEILQKDQHIWLRIDDVVQSAMERQPPYRPILPHTLIMMLPLIHHKVPGKVLELGGGGQSCQRYFQHTQPNIQFLSVELNLDVIQAVQQYFPASEALNIVNADAFEFVAELALTKEKYDWIMIDLFHGAESPFNAKHHDFIHHIHRCLAEDGWLIINCLTPSVSEHQALCDKLFDTFQIRPHLFAVPEMQNYIIMLQKNNQFIFPSEIETHSQY